MNNDGEIRIGTKVDNSGFEKGVKDLKKEAEQADKEITQIMSKSASSTNKFGNAIGGVAKKAVSLGSALFNIVAVGAGIGALAIGGFILGKALDKANGKSEQLKANLSYIGFVASKIFENLLQPAIDKTTGAVNGLVGALYKAVVYIGYILSKWTGKDLFAGTSTKDYAKSMEEANKSAKKTAKSTKQIKKDLMGFDEVNKLTEDTKTGKITMPTLPKIGDVKIPEWVQWIADHKDVILKVTGAILALLTFSKVVSWLAPLGSFFKLFAGGKLASGLSGVLGTLGTILAIAGSIAVIGISAKTWWEGNVKQGKQLLKIGKKGVEYSKEDAKNFETINDMQETLNYKRKYSNELLQKSTGWAAAITMSSSELEQNVKDVVTQQDNYLQEQIEAYRQGKLTKEQQDQLKAILSDQVDYLVDIGDGLDEAGKDSKYIRDMGAEYRDVLKEMGVEVQSNPLTEFWDKIYGRTENAKKNIGSIISTNIPDKNVKINVDADTSKANSKIGSIVTGVATSLQTALNKIKLTSLIDKFADLFNGLNKNFGFKFDVTNIKKKLGLRQGGIINVPGRGVALGNNIIGGEAGAEAVVPLNDETMDRLGSAIARHMTINATMINQMNGRTISRELKTIMNENDFSYNR